MDLLDITLDDNFFTLDTSKERERWLFLYCRKTITTEYSSRLIQDLVQFHEAFEEIKEIDNEIDQLTKRKNAIKARTRQASRYFIDNPDYNDILYWAFPGITHASNKSASTIVIPYSTSCSQCGDKNEQRLEIKSQSDLKHTASSPPNGYIDCSCQKRAKEGLKRQQEQHLSRLEELRTMPYQKYLQTPEWQEIRHRALRKAKHRCELCAKEGVLHIHHKTYKNRGNEPLTDLIVLCQHCHRKFHDKLDTKE